MVCPMASRFFFLVNWEKVNILKKQQRMSFFSVQLEATSQENLPL